MSHLVLEIVLTLLAATAIGWFLGRYLCKSGEYEERNKKQHFIKQTEHLQRDLHTQNQHLTTAREELNKHSSLTAELEQQKDGLKAQLLALETERDNMLGDIQKVEMYQTRLNTLQDEFELHKQQMLELRTEKVELTEQLADWENKMQRENERFQLGYKQFDAAQERIKVLENELDSHKHRYQTLSEERQHLQQEHNDLRQQYREVNARLNSFSDEKEQLNRELERLNIEKNDYLGRLQAISSVVGATTANTNVLNLEYIEDKD